MNELNPADLRPQRIGLFLDVDGTFRYARAPKFLRAIVGAYSSGNRVLRCNIPLSYSMAGIINSAMRLSVRWEDVWCRVSS